MSDMFGEFYAVSNAVKEVKVLVNFKTKEVLELTSIPEEHLSLENIERMYKFGLTAEEVEKAINLFKQVLALNLIHSQLIQADNKLVEMGF